jgi:hypothetical protein
MKERKQDVLGAHYTQQTQKNFLKKEEGNESGMSVNILFT